MADWGIKVSLPGYDVKTATVEQCVVHSGYASPKVDMRSNPAHFGTIKLLFTQNPPTNTNTLLWTLNHGYSYIPATLVTGSFSQLTGPQGDDGIFPILIGATLDFFTRTTGTQLQVWANVDTSVWNLAGSTLTWTYYVFAESGA